jgi:hypothetical protein
VFKLLFHHACCGSVVHLKIIGGSLRDVHGSGVFIVLLAAFEDARMEVESIDRVNISRIGTCILV